MKLEDLTLDVEQHVDVQGALDDVFKSVLHRFGGGCMKADGESLQLQIEPFAGGRWFRGQHRDRAAGATDTAAKTTGAAAGGAILGLVGSMIGALAAARRRTTENVLEGMGKRKHDDAHQPPPMRPRREETIIVPPEA